MFVWSSTSTNDDYVKYSWTNFHMVLFVCVMFDWLQPLKWIRQNTHLPKKMLAMLDQAVYILACYRANMTHVRTTEVHLKCKNAPP